MNTNSEVDGSHIGSTAVIQPLKGAGFGYAMGILVALSMTIFLDRQVINILAERISIHADGAATVELLFLDYSAHGHGPFVHASAPTVVADTKPELLNCGAPSGNREIKRIVPPASVPGQMS